MNKNKSSEVTLDGENKMNALVYANDLILLFETKERVQKQIDKLITLCTKWKLDINVKKTKGMFLIVGVGYTGSKNTDVLESCVSKAKSFLTIITA